MTKKTRTPRLPGSRCQMGARNGVAPLEARWPASTSAIETARNPSSPGSLDEPARACDFAVSRLPQSGP